MIDFICWKSLSDLSAELIINVLNAYPYVQSVIFPLKSIQTGSSCCVTKGLTFLCELKTQFNKDRLMGLSFVLAEVFSSEKNGKFLKLRLHLRELLMLVESEDLGCLFIKFLLRYRSLWRRQKQTRDTFLSPEKTSRVYETKNPPSCHKSTSTNQN